MLMFSFLSRYSKNFSLDLFNLWLKNNKFMFLKPIKHLTYSVIRLSKRTMTSFNSLEHTLCIINAIAPTKLASDWDNVGLLIEPSSPHVVQKLMLTNDLTQPVLSEALECGTSMILCYHPPIFRSLKQVTQSCFKERLVVQCLENRIAVFSPHTSMDVACDGVNDWLIKAFGVVNDVNPLIVTDSMFGVDAAMLTEESIQRIKEENNVYKNMNKKEIGFYHVSANLASDILPASAVKKIGVGRKAVITTPMTLLEAVESVKKYLRLPNLRLAVGEGKTLGSPVHTVACCAGSGSSVLNNCDVDVYLSGEMSHHDVLHATSQGHSVILCEHSNTERGFLHYLRAKLSSLLPGVDICVSKTDADPLLII